MLIDRPQVVEGSSVINLTVPTGTADPSSPSTGELFFRTDLGVLRVYSSSWVEAGAGGLGTHSSDTTVHLSAAQNTFLDALNLPTLTAAHVNFVTGLTSNAQVQFNTIVTNFNTHTGDQTVHLTSAQNTWLDSITASAVEINYLVGVTSLVQTQLNNIVIVDNGQNTRLTTLEGTTVPAVQTNLTNHIADAVLHLTSFQNTLLDGLAATLTAAELNFVDGVTSSIQTQLNTLAGSSFAQKLSTDGTLSMTANLSLGGNRITNLATPTAASDAATKDYVDSFVQGLHWVGSCAVATTANITLSGLQTIDGVSLAISDRVLVKNQSTPSQNGIYLAASGAWSRSNDYNLVIEVNNSAVFVLNGTTQNKSTWIQTATVVTLDTSTISFSAFSGPVVNTAGGGVTLGVNGQVSVNQGAGLTFDGNNALVVDLHSSGGLMVTSDNASPVPLTTVAAQLALTNTGVVNSTYNNSVTAITPFTVDLKGRITGTGAAVTITPAWASITSKPTTLGTFGITDAVPIAGGVTMTGNLSWFAGTTISANAPSSLNAYFSTAAYGISQGDNKTHFGYNNSGTFMNYIRGVLTQVDSNMTVNGTLSASNATSTVDPNNFVRRTGTGNILTNFLNSTDASITTGVSGVMVKQGNNDLKTGTAASIAEFISGQNFNTTGRANTAGVADSANAVLWTNVSDRPTLVSQFTNDANYITSGGVSGSYVSKIGDVMTGPLGLTGPSAGNDPYGRLSVTMANDGNSYGYIGMTRSGAVGWSMGIDTSNRVFFGAGSSGTASNVVSRPFTLDTAGNLALGAGISTVNSASFANGAFVVNGAGVVATLNGFSPPNGVIRMTPNLHLNPGAGSAVICSWDNGNGGNAASLAFRVGNGSGGDVFTVSYAGTTVISGNVSAANITDTSGIGSRIVRADAAGYINNTYFNSSDNTVASGVSAVMVKQGNDYLRSGTAQAIATFLSGTTMNISGSATSVAWTNVSGRPTLFYDFGSNGGVSSPGPNTFPSGSISGFDGYSTSDMGQYQVGVTVVGNGGNGSRSVQIAANWNFEEAAPNGLRFRVNDDTNNTSAWGAFRTIWDQGNLVNVSQLTNDSSFITASALSSYATTASLSSYATTTSLANYATTASLGNYLPRTVDAWHTSTDGLNRLYFGSNGRTYLSSGNGFEFRRNDTAAIFIVDNAGNATATGDVIAYSDRRLKTDVQVIQDPLQKVQELIGVTYKRIDSGEVSTGLIAQDVQAVLPEAVTEDDAGILGVKYGNLAGLFVEAIKALNKEVAELRAEVKALKDAQ